MASRCSAGVCGPACASSAARPSTSMKLSHESPVSPPWGPMGGGAFIVAVREHSLQYMYHTIPQLPPIIPIVPRGQSGMISYYSCSYCRILRQIRLIRQMRPAASHVACMASWRGPTLPLGRQLQGRLGGSTKGVGWRATCGISREGRAGLAWLVKPRRWLAAVQARTKGWRWWRRGRGATAGSVGGALRGREPRGRHILYEALNCMTYH